MESGTYTVSWQIGPREETLMTSIATPNWLAMAGFIYLALAFGLALSGMMRSAPGGTLLQRTRAEAGRRVDALAAMPFLAVGMICLVAAQMVSAPASPSMIVLILSAPLALLLYMGFEGLWTDAQIEESAADAQPAKPLLRLPSPSAAPAQTLAAANVEAVAAPA
jgi:hypothetical protein